MADRPKRLRTQDPNIEIAPPPKKLCSVRETTNVSTATVTAATAATNGTRNDAGASMRSDDDERSLVPKNTVIHLPPSGPLGISIYADSVGRCVVERVSKSSKGSFRAGDVIETFNGRLMRHGSYGLKEHDKVKYWSNLISPRPPTTTNYMLVLRAPKTKNIAAATMNKTKRNLKKAPPSTATGGNKRKRSKKSKYVELPKVPLTVFPLPGTICPKSAYYVTRRNETYSGIAQKLGLDDWRDLAFISENVERYGEVSCMASTQFNQRTPVRIPTTKCSKWKLSKLVDTHSETMEELGVCSKCSKRELPGDLDPMLMCDGCDATQHLSCSGLSSVPDGDWLCQACEDILRARKKYYHDSKIANAFQASLPQLPELPSSVKATAIAAKSNFLSYLTERKKTELKELKENHTTIFQRLEDCEARLKTIDIPALSLAVRTHRDNFVEQEEHIKLKHNVISWGPSVEAPSWVDMKEGNGTCRTYKRQDDNTDWRRVASLFSIFRDERRLARGPLKRAEEALETERLRLRIIKEEQDERRHLYGQKQQQLLLKYAILNDEPQLLFESKAQYNSRPSQPSFLGICLLQDDSDVHVLNMLCEPTELILAIPMTRQASSAAGDDGIDDSTASSTKTSAQRFVVGEEYAIFGVAALFEAKRDDSLPMDLSSNGSVRVAQKRLMSMLLRNGQPLQVTCSSVPSSVRIRGDENLQYVTKCFDLSELVRDCNCPLDMPKAPTPKRLMDHGLILKDYQQLSLQWMLDKECHTTGMGFAGELWSRMQFLDGSGQFFFCETTGSMIKDIFDFKSDSEQKDAVEHLGSLPAGGILGEEMGLGKTIISIALICANPPPLHNQVLPREHLARIDHPLYTAPPSPRCNSSSGSKFLLSNATVIISPLTLQSQWLKEIKRFAPWLSVLTLHNNENPTREEIASKDVVVISTFLLQQRAKLKSGKKSRGSFLLSKLKRIHFHRCILDESHYNQSGTKIKQSLAKLSSTYRFCVTGTPIGHSLDHLQGQLRFLRVPQFCRSGFWKQNIGTPYLDRNYDALRVLRSLLSRIVIRHSKQQTKGNGSAMLSLPPRTVETILLPFESKAEQRLYNTLEKRNLKRFKELRSQSPKTVLGRYMELNGMIYAARRACAHAELINLDSVQKCNASLSNGKRYDYKKQGQVPPMSKSLTRSEILEQAIGNAKDSAKTRMRETILDFQDGKTDLIECPVCLEPTGECDIALTPCAHKFCVECIVSVLSGASSSREAKGHCPQCREVIRRSELTFLADATEAGEKYNLEREKKEENKKLSATPNISAKVNGFQFNSKDILGSANGSSTPRFNYKYLTRGEKRQQRAYCYAITPEFLADHARASSCLGTKISRLLEEINNMFSKDPKSKCVVFSQFLGSLDIASEELKARGIPFVRIDGTMGQHKRADALLEFFNNPNTRVFFLSMRSGAAGLNLMAADHCFILDAPMNSAIEEQAIDRIHRIGQNRPVVVKRFIIKDSIEERILANRRSLTADHPTRAISTEIDGTGMLAAEQTHLRRNARRGIDVDANSIQRLKLLEALFGHSGTVCTMMA